MKRSLRKTIRIWKQPLSLIIVAAILLSAAACSNETRPIETQSSDYRNESPVPSPQAGGVHEEDKLGDDSGERRAFMLEPADLQPKYQNRGRNFFGIHTMIFPEDNRDQHLDWAWHLVGDGGYVKQMIGPITIVTEGADDYWSDLVRGIYERNMIPVLRLTTTWRDGIWDQPDADANGAYEGWAEAVKRVVSGLPRKAGVPLYIEVLNEVNLSLEWGGERPNPVQYGQVLVAVSKAIRSIGDPRIRIVTGGLSPNGEYDHIAFLNDMFAAVPESIDAFDYLGSHPYPGDHPPEYNIHDGTAADTRNTIDGYLNELAVIEKYGRSGVQVLITETGYAIGNNAYAGEGMKAINRELQFDYTLRAFRDYWSKWPEVVAVMPFELSATAAKNWTDFDWIDPYSESDENGYPTRPYGHYEAISRMPKLPYLPEEDLKGTKDVHLYPLAEKDPLNWAFQARVKASSSIEQYGWSLRKLTNGTTSPGDLGWSSDGEKDAEEWVSFQFPELKPVSKVVLVPRTDQIDQGAYFPQGYVIQYLDDHAEWKNAFAYTHKDTFNPGKEEQVITFDKIEASSLRLLITKKTNKGEGGYHAQLSEVRIYE